MKLFTPDVRKDRVTDITAETLRALGAKGVVVDLDNTLGDRLTWFSAGAHCGMFHTPEFKQEVLGRLNLAGH